jgi:hypothetical protein
VALFQLKGSSNEESEFEHVKFSENRCGYSKEKLGLQLLIEISM